MSVSNWCYANKPGLKGFPEGDIHHLSSGLHTSTWDHLRAILFSWLQWWTQTEVSFRIITCNRSAKLVVFLNSRPGSSHRTIISRCVLNVLGHVSKPHLYDENSSVQVLEYLFLYHHNLYQVLRHYYSRLCRCCYPWLSPKLVKEDIWCLF